MGYQGPYLAWFATQQRAPVPSTSGIQYLVYRVGVTRASSVLADAGSNTALTLYGIGKYAGSAGNKLKVTVTETGSPTNQVYTLALSGTGLGGTYTLGFNGATTAAISETASAATVQAALIALNSNYAGAISVSGTTWTGTGGTYTVTLSGNLAATNFPNLVINSTSITGTISSFTSTVTTPGVRPTVQTLSVLDYTNASSPVTVQTFSDTSVAGGTYNLTSNQGIVNAINGANPLTNINSVVTASLGPSYAPPAAVTTQVFSGGLDGQGTAASAVTQSLLQSSLWTQADYIVTGWDGATIAPTLLSHFTDGLAQNDFRKAYLGPAIGTSYTTMSASYVSSAIQSSRLVMVGNDNATANHPATGVPVQWDGFYLAAAAAGLKASAPQSETCAGFPIAGFTQIGPSTGLTQQLLASQVTALESQGLTVFVQPLGTNTISMHNVLSTAPYQSPSNSNAVNAFSQASVQDADDGISRIVVGATQPFLLRVPTGNTQQYTKQIENVLTNALGGAATLHNGINQVSVTLDPATLILSPYVSYKARYPTTTIQNTTALTLS
jgi:hypothetical protein